MTLAALIDAGVDAGAVCSAIASLGLPITVEVEKVRKGGFAATHVRVEAPTEDRHRFLPDVEEILQRGSLTPRQRELALKIFRRLAEAEAAVHGMPLEKVHFHEVGALDSIADIAGAAVALDLLGVERFTSGSVAVGSGTVKCAHGLMPIPAPGTAELLKGVPLRPSPVKAELTTPTGAAILTTVVEEWVEQPALTIERIGHGAGRREFVEQPNLLRLFAAGALDVFTTPIFMKKNRPGVLLSVLAPETAISAVEEVLFRETTTLGVRRYQASRHKLHREPCTVATPWGAIQGKLNWLEGRAPVFAPEYEDCAGVARQHGVSLREVYARAQEAYRAVALQGSTGV